MIGGTGVSKRIYASLAFAAAAVLLLGAAGISAGLSPAQCVLLTLFALLGLIIVFMAASLRASLKRTLYAYTNIGLIGGILFAAALALMLLGELILGWSSGDFSLRRLFHAVVEFPRIFSYYAVFVIGAVCVLLAVSNIALIRKEGFCLSNALSLLVAAFFLGGTAAAYWLSDLLKTRVFLPRGVFADPVFVILHTVVPLFILLVLCYFECVLVGTVIMGWKAAHQKPAYDKDYIIILGCSIDKRGGLLPLLRGRVNRAVRFAWEQEIQTGKPMKYVPSGGKGTHEVMSEGSAMELYLLTHGAESDEVFPEKESVNTQENMRVSKKIIDALKPDARIAFATTNYHMLRSGILARMEGIDAEGIAGDTKWYFWPNGFVREYFGILTLKPRAHLCVAAFAAVVCAAIGCLGYFGGLV